jgi:putative ABC transport system permease protein
MTTTLEGLRQHLAWISGTTRRRRGRFLAATAGIAMTVTTLAFLAMFNSASRATMTDRAASSVAVDWQIALDNDAAAARVTDTLTARGGVSAVDPVQFLTARGIEATTGGTRQVTGRAAVLGLPATYTRDFPTVVRKLVGADTGVLLAQQTAANLHVRPGQDITLLWGDRPAAVTVDGVVELPQADSLFQKVGAPPQSQPLAPPDNVVLMPVTLAQRLAASSGVTPAVQLHVALTDRLPADPASAYAATLADANNLEADLAGSVKVGNNLGAALDAAREDAAYSQILFLFLGAPAAVLAGLLTAVVVGAGGDRRRGELALLRLRGARRRTVLSLAATEAACVGALGTLVGLGSALLVGGLALHSLTFGASATAGVVWLLVIGAVGLLTAQVCYLLPAARDLRTLTVADSRRRIDRAGAATRYAGLAIALVLLVVSGLVFWATSRSKYALVLAPEGVPKLSISYWAFAAPALLWLGAYLVTRDGGSILLRHGRRPLATALAPLNRRITSTVVAGIVRNHAVVARASTLLALAVAFAISAATFNSTYAQQAEVDAQLTNGADVQVVLPSSGSAANPPAEQRAARRLGALPGVRHVETMQHRFAYVGNDLQDLYGIDTQTLPSVTALQDAYFQGGTADQILTRLHETPSGVLVSAETVTDFNLTLGDHLKLRLRDAATGNLQPIPFTYVGVANEFPTAPKDSFLVANESYVAEQTHDPAAGTFLLDTDPGQERAVADAARKDLGTTAVVTDITQTRGLIGSSLTAVDLRGLTRVELVLAAVLVLAAAALVTGLQLAERRRTFAIAHVLGARRRQLVNLAVSEAALTSAIGLASGAIIGWAMSHMLVKVLSGVFDPPPTALAVPWGYLVTVAVSALAAVAAASAVAARLSAIATVADLRDHD